MNASGHGASDDVPDSSAAAAPFDYSAIPPGYYDRMMRDGPSIQRAWHRQKFARVRADLELKPGGRLLDVGCGPGSFLGSFNASVSPSYELVGIDIAPEQIEYAHETYGSSNRRFHYVDPSTEWPFPDGYFDAVTLIEVIEHLDRDQIRAIVDRCTRVLKPHGKLVITTPNYLSHWPLLEWLVARLSAVSYHEQHITKFNRLTVRRRLLDICGERFRFEHATTMHFIAPFLAPLSERLSDQVATALAPSHWAWPFGSLIIGRLTLRSSED